MNIKEKHFLKRNLIAFLIIIGIYLLVTIIGGRMNGRIFKDYLFSGDVQKLYDSLEPEQVRLEFEKDGIVRLGEVTKEEGRLLYSLYPEKAGKVAMSIYNEDTNELISETVFRVSRTGLITDCNTDNFTNYRISRLNIVFLCLALTILLWFAFAYCQRKLRYSYQSIFYSGLALWMTLITILQIHVTLTKDNMLQVYSTLQTASYMFILVTFIPLLLFCIALSVSNIDLIRHEGFRSRNALGIILSFIMILGALINFVLPELMTSGPDFQMRIFMAITGVYSSIYVFMECFLMGSVICGTLAARHEPEYDMDYLVILGCKIRKDGTLYPLIRGRVDRAITFYQKQLEKTGKKAIFLPSGGQGSDECISEAAAMKRYLLEQGIPEEQILVEDQSKNTLENMRFSKKLIEERTPNAKVAFSTTNFHVFRSGIISRQNDFEPDGMGSPTKWYFWPNAYMREVVGMMAYKWKSMVIVLLPIILFFIAIQFVG